MAILWHLFVTDLQKPDIIVHFCNSILLHFYNLHIQLYVLANLSSYSKTFEVAALKSNSNRRLICTVSIRERKFQALSKMDIT